MNDCKTKIIATIGDPKITYRDGIYDINMDKIEAPTLDQVMDIFLAEGVDIVRMNLAHVGQGIQSAEGQQDAVREKFGLVKKALLAAERRFNNSRDGMPERHIGILADLPGPKIRFNQTKMWVLPTKELRISLFPVVESFSDDMNKPDDSSIVQVNIGARPFAEIEPKAATDILRQINDLKRNNNKPLLAFIGDNDFTLVVERVSKEGHIICNLDSVAGDERLVKGGNRGFTIRGVEKAVRAFTPEDKNKLTAILMEDYEGFSPAGEDRRVLSHIGLSFCQTSEDAMEALFHMYGFLKKKFKSVEECMVSAPTLIAKIETTRGVKNIDPILDFADGAMIARGDLALEAAMTDLPENAKEIIRVCRMRGKPVVMATQMLESMKNSIECRRPEAMDVFNAVVDGVDATMLSGETSSGTFPAHAINTMRNLACSAEAYLDDLVSETKSRQAYRRQLDKFNERTEERRVHYYAVREVFNDRFGDKIIALETEMERQDLHEEERSEIEATIKSLKKRQDFIQRWANIKQGRQNKQMSTDHVSHAIAMMSAETTVAGILTPTTSGRTARMIARFRPIHEIFAQPHTELTARKLCMIRGVRVSGVLPPLSTGMHDVLGLMKQSRESKERDTRLQKGAVIFACGTPLGKVGSTNLIQRW